MPKLFNNLQPIRQAIFQERCVLSVSMKPKIRVGKLCHVCHDGSPSKSKGVFFSSVYVDC